MIPLDPLYDAEWYEQAETCIKPIGRIAQQIERMTTEQLAAWFVYDQPSKELLEAAQLDRDDQAKAFQALVEFNIDNP